MKRKLAYLVFFQASLFARSALAEIHTGNISNIHLNSTENGRGVCVQMAPGLSTGWACLNDPNSNLYKEITLLLLTGYASKVTCSTQWSEVDGYGFAKITLVECS